MENYLVIQGARFGDLIQTKRLILSLSKIGNVFLLLDRSLEKLAKLVFPTVKLFPINFHFMPNEFKFDEDLPTFSDLAGMEFKYIYNCNFSPLTATICRLFDQDKIIGYRPAHCDKGGILRSQWARLAFRLTSARKLTPLNLVDFWGWFMNSPLSAQEVNDTVSIGGGGLGIAVSGREERRSLPTEILANLINVIFQIGEYKKIKFFGTTNEIAKANRIIHLLPEKLHSHVINYTGKTSLTELYEEVATLDLLLTPDTGIMHLGAHCGVPILAFFLSSANCHETGPYGKGHIIFQSVADCSPCLESAYCDKGIRCLEPFKNKFFTRLMVSLLKKNLNFQSDIPGLQCWISDIDDFGQKLQLIAGEDPYLLERKILWDLIKNYVGIFDQIGTQSPNLSIENNLIKKFFPNADWMLPPRRYI